MDNDVGRAPSGSGSHPSDQAPAGLGASRFDPSRCRVLSDELWAIHDALTHIPEFEVREPDLHLTKRDCRAILRDAARMLAAGDPARAALRGLVALKRDILIDIGARHAARVNTADEETVQRDTDFRLDLTEAFARAASAMAETENTGSIGDESAGPKDDAHNQEGSSMTKDMLELAERGYTADEVRELLRQECNGNQRAWALRNGISATFLSDVLSGRREPSGAVLNPLKLDRIVTYRRRI